METQQTQNHENALQPIENIVENADGQMFTTSLIIAQAFEKEHKNVLQNIQNLECSAQFNQLNFQPVEYKDAKGEMRPAYRITRDGFAFLAMGFTGKKAAAWKEKFLEAFNAMERQLTKRISIEVPAIESNETRKNRFTLFLRGFIAYWAFVDKIPYIAAEMALCTHFDVSKLEEVEDINGAMYFLNKASIRPTGDTQTKKATENELIILKNMLNACSQMRHTRDMDFEEFFLKETGINPHKIPDICEHDAQKLITYASCILYQAYQYTLDWNDFIGLE